MLKEESVSVLQQYETSRLPRFCQLINRMELRNNQHLDGVANLLGIPHRGSDLILKTRTDFLLLCVTLEALGQRAMQIRNSNDECADRYGFYAIGALIPVVRAMRAAVQSGIYEMRAYSLFKPFTLQLKEVLDELTAEQKRLEGFQ